MGRDPVQSDENRDEIEDFDYDFDDDFEEEFQEELEEPDDSFLTAGPPKIMPDEADSDESNSK